MTKSQAMQYNKFKKPNLKIDIAYLQTLLLTNALPCFYMIVNPCRIRASFPSSISFPPYITKIQQDFDSRQWSEEVHPSKISF